MVLFYLPKKLRGKLKGHAPVEWMLNTCVFLFSAFILFIIAFKVAEGVTWIEAIWQAWQTMTTIGYGNKPAETVSGRIGVILIGTIGLALLSVLIGAVVEVFTYFKDQRRYGFMKNNQKGGYVVFNFPGTHQLLSFIKEVRYVEKDAGVCVVDNRLDELPAPIVVIPNVHFVRGKLTSKDTYEKAGLADCKAVIIFPLDQSSPDSDSATKTIVDLVEDFIGNETRIMHVLVDPENRWLFKKTKSRQILESVEVLTIVQECQDEYSSGIIQQLLLNSEGENPKTVTPKHIDGWRWEEFLQSLIQAGRKTGIVITPLALVSGGKITSCPRLDTVIGSGDLLSIIAENGFDWESYEREIVRNKVSK